ncbi:MAG: hypothetical protein WKF96_03055 [Solirubrobacteraceae bacterium]
MEAARQGTQADPRARTLPIRLDQDRLYIGNHLSISFQRTVRIPDDGGSYPLPPGLGQFPIRRVQDYAERVPESWRARGGVFLPMYQREAMWLSCSGGWPPVALKVGIGKVNAVSGKAWDETLDGRDQDYLVCPDQPWLDGINSGEGTIRQFVAMPLGMGYTVEGQLTGKETVGGLQLMAVDAHPDRLPTRPEVASYDMDVMACMAPAAEMGLGAGGQMEQEIYPDEYGVDTWDQQRSGRVFVHIADSMTWREITGDEPPPTPVSAASYAEHGLPWFSRYDERRGDLARSDELGRVKSVKQMDLSKGFGDQQDDRPVEIPEAQVVELGRPDGTVSGGEW